MTKITFMGAGSTIFARNILGDCMQKEALKDAEIALYDIDGKRLQESELLVNALNTATNDGRATIKSYCGVENRKAALQSSDFVVNAINVGGYEPATVIDFEVPKKYGLRQTIADTLGIGGIFRALRTAPIMLDFAREMEEVAPNAWFLNYTNPMAILTGAMLHGSGVKTVGLCHSVQVVAENLFSSFIKDRDERKEFCKDIRCKVAGINHMAWLLEITKNGKDLYPEVKQKVAEMMPIWRAEKDKSKKPSDMVRLEMMMKLGYYITESSEHNAEYSPYWIKHNYPELIDEYKIPLDEYISRCIRQIEEWQEQYKRLCANPNVTHTVSAEYGSNIINSIVTNNPCQIAGNVVNNGLITNLPNNAIVEVPCLVDANGVQGCYVGALPPQCAAMNMTNINTQLLTVEAILTGKKEHIYHAAMLDPHTAAELSIDDIISLCDDLIEVHGDMLPKFV